MAKGSSSGNPAPVSNENPFLASPDPSLDGIYYSTVPDIGDEDNSHDNSDPQPPQVSTRQVTNVYPGKPLIIESQFYGVLTDGYYRKSAPNGGYGVVIIDRTGIPIAAKSEVSEVGAISEYYHTLEGIKAGLEFARKHGITKICMACNNDSIAVDVEYCIQSSQRGYCIYKDLGSSEHPNFDTFCITCCLPDIIAEERVQVVKIMKDIVHLGIPYYFDSLVTKIDKSSNRAAGLLAKCGKKEEYRHDKIPPEVLGYWVKMEYPGRYAWDFRMR